MKKIQILIAALMVSAAAYAQYWGGYDATFCDDGFCYGIRKGWDGNWEPKAEIISSPCRENVTINPGVSYDGQFFNVDFVPDRAFKNCITLKYVRIYVNFSIFSEAFSGCSGLEEVSIGCYFGSNIGNSAFSGCSGLKKFTNYVPTSLGTNVFDGVNKTTCTVYVPQGSVNSYKEADQWKDFVNIREVTDYSSASYELNAKILNKWSGTETVVDIDADWRLGNVLEIGNACFSGNTTIKSLYLGYKTIKISDNAFAGAINLTEITIPEKVMTIGKQAFAGCTSLTTINMFSTTPPALSGIVFEGVNKATCVLYVPAGAKQAYQAADQWKDFQNIVEITTGIQTNKLLSLEVYPNPASDFINIFSSDIIHSIDIVDITGKTIHYSNINANTSNIDIKSLPQGAYFVKASTDKGMVVRKIVKK